MRVMSLRVDEDEYGYGMAMLPVLSVFNGASTREDDIDAFVLAVRQTNLSEQANMSLLVQASYM